MERKGKVKIEPPFDPLPVINSFCIGEEIYAVTYDGIFRLDKKKMKWRRFMYSPDKAEPSDIKYERAPQ